MDPPFAPASNTWHRAGLDESERHSLPSLTDTGARRGDHGSISISTTLPPHKMEEEDFNPPTPKDLDLDSAPRPPYTGALTEQELDETSNTRLKWLDYIPLPYDFVVPQMLRKHIVRHSLTPQQRKQWQKDAAQQRWFREKREDDHGGSRDGQVCTIPKSLQLRQARLDFLRRIIAEVIGTCLLVFAHGVLRMKASPTVHTLSEGENAVFAGLTLVLLIYSLGEVSGAHFNPVVTFGFCARGMFPWVWLIPYYLAEFAGACAAGGIIRGLFGLELARKATSYTDPEGPLVPWKAMWLEAVLTFYLIFVILSICQRGKVIGVHAALAVGAAIGLDVAMGARITGGSMNPFRSLGPALVNGPLEPVWPMVAGPYIGGILAILATYLIATGDEDPARGPAIGKGKEEPDVEHDREEPGPGPCRSTN